MDATSALAFPLQMLCSKEPRLATLKASTPANLPSAMRATAKYPAKPFSQRARSLERFCSKRPPPVASATSVQLTTVATPPCGLACLICRSSTRSCVDPPRLGTLPSVKWDLATMDWEALIWTTALDYDPYSLGSVASSIARVV